MPPYTPEKCITGPAYSRWFKLLATLVSMTLAVYLVKVALNYPLLQYGLGVKALIGATVAMLALSYYWFLRSTTTIDASGITQTWLMRKRVEWTDIRGARMIGIPYLSWLFPPRLVVRTSNFFVTFNAASPELLTEFAKISLAFQLRR